MWLIAAQRSGGKLIVFLMAALAEFERDLLRERVRSGIAVTCQRSGVFVQRSGQRVRVGGQPRKCSSSSAKISHTEISATGSG